MVDAASLEECVKSERFYMEADVVGLKADNTLFQIHKSDLERHSRYFLDLFTPSVKGLQPGKRAEPLTRMSEQSVEGVIVLRDVSARELEAFLSVLYPEDFDTFGLDAEGEDDWVAVLKIAHLWDCPVIKALAVTHLHTIWSTLPEDMSFRRLELARMYDVDAWVETAINGLAARSMLTVSEIARMQRADLRYVVEAWETKRRESATSTVYKIPAADDIHPGIPSPQDDQTSKSTTASNSNFPPQLPSKSTWARGSSPVATSRSQAPLSSTPATHGTPCPAVDSEHSRRSSTLGQGESVKDGVAIPRNAPAAAKAGGPSVTFCSIDNAGAPISSSLAAPPGGKSDDVTEFDSVPVSGEAEKSVITNRPQAPSASSSTTPSTASTAATTAPISTPSPAPKLNKRDISKLFLGPPVAAPPHASSPPPAESTASPASRLSNLPHANAPAFVPPPFTPGGLRTGQGAPPGGPPRSPSYTRPMANGQNGNVPGRPPSGPNAGVPQAMHSPRMGQHPPPGQPAGMPPMGPWGPYYAYPYGMPPPPPGSEGMYQYPQPPSWGMPPQGMPPHHRQQPGGPVVRMETPEQKKAREAAEEIAEKEAIEDMERKEEEAEKVAREEEAERKAREEAEAKKVEDFGKNISQSFSSALATARSIDDINSVAYPEGIQSPKLELNVNASKGKFKYDRDFLLQFMAVCKDKPDNLPPLDAIDLEPSDQAFGMTRDGSGRRALGMQTPSRSNNPIGLGFGPIGKAGMGNFAMPTGAASKLSSEERFAMASRSASTSGAGMPRAGVPPLSRTSSQGGPGGGDRRRTRSSRGHAREDNRQSTVQQPPSNMQPPLEPVAPVEATANRWTPASMKRGATADMDSPELVDRKVKALLNKLTMERFDSISDQIIEWANESEKEKDGRTLIQVIRLVFEKATDEATFSEMYARLCRKMMKQISTKVQDDGILNNEGKPFAGGQLFRKYLLNRCQEDFERGWAAKDAAAKATEDAAVKEAANKAKESGKVDDGEEFELYSDEYYSAAKAKRRGLGLIQFIGELFKLQMLTERTMHECIKKLLGNVEYPKEEEIESLCKLLTTVGSVIDTPKGRVHMDVYFSRMKEIAKSKNVDSPMTLMLQDVIELRGNTWQPRNKVAAPTTLSRVNEQAAKNRPKAGDLTNFGKITKQQPMTFGPSGVLAKGKKDGPAGSVREGSVSRTASVSRNMFDMLSGSDAPEAPVATKSSRPPSHKPNVDLRQAGASDAPMQRRKLNLLPRNKPIEVAAKTEEESDEEDEEDAEEQAGQSMYADEAKRKIDEDIKELFSIQSLDEAESYFTSLPAEYRWQLVDKMCNKGTDSKASETQLVTNLLTRAHDKSLADIEAFEKGLEPLAEFIDDIAIDVPKAFDIFAGWMRATGIAADEERRTRIAEKLPEGKDKLLGMLA